MGRDVRKLIKFFIFLKYFAPFMAFIYLCAWTIGVFSESFYIFSRKLIGLFPLIIEKIIYVEADLAGKDISMSYIHCACIFMVVMFISAKSIARLEKVQKLYENKELERRVVAQKELKKLKEKQKKDVICKRNVFFGLFEFRLDYFNYYGKFKSDIQELRKLKIEYCKMIVGKLKEKYPKIKFISAEKLFFMCDDFSVFSSVTKDIVKLFKGFLNIGNKKGIKTEMLLSYWAGDKNTNAKGTYKILERINELNHINKVIVASGIYFRYMEEHEKDAFEFAPMGASKLINIDSSGGDLDLNLYMIKSSN